MSEVDWESRYGAADTPWDKGLPHPMLSHWLGKIEVDGAIVVPGCGRGWDLRAWAEAYPENEVIGIDLAPSAVVSARENCADLANVSVKEADFFDLSQWYDGQKVGLIWEHTCFCAIPPTLRDAYLETVVKLLPSGAHLVGVFFTDLEDPHNGPPWNTNMAEIEQRFAPHFLIEAFDGEHQTFPGREGEERTLVMRRV